jgi:hypothetical protein
MAKESKTIITFDGTPALRKNCRRYKNGFYEMGRQCIKMEDDRYYRIDSGKIIYDHLTKKYVFNSVDYIRGIVNTIGNNVEFGYFKRDKILNVYVKGIGLAVNEKALNNAYIERLRTGEFYHRSQVPRDFSRIKLGGTYSKETDYHASYRQDEITRYFEKYFEPLTVKDYWKDLPEYATYGIEYETRAGIIPERLCLKNGLIPVKDGSLRRERGISFEYATVILEKNNVFPAIKEHSRLLNKYCSKSINESLHVHIGGYTPSKEFLVNLYHTFQLVQKELFKMFPEFIRKTSVFKNSNKNYCKPIKKVTNANDSIDNNFDRIISFLSQGNIEPGDFRYFGQPHPADPHNRSKWNVKSRYYAMNLVPLVFKGTGTVEFRMHTNTFNKDKIASWLMITTAIVEYSYKTKESSSNLPTSLSLNTIVDNVYTNKTLRKYLKAYIKYRKDLMKYNQNMYRDFIGKLDVEQDNLNNFKFPIKELV